MLAGMTSQQFVEWQVFGELEPFAPERDDYRTGMIVRTLANAHRSSKHHPTPYTLEDCTPRFGDLGRASPKKQSWQHMMSIAKALAEGSQQDAELERITGRRLSIV
jgi:hypothetical protein